MFSRHHSLGSTSLLVGMESPVDVFSCTRLFLSGLRVSTPPNAGRPVSRKLQLVPDENNPPSPPHTFIRSRSRTPLDDQDPNSQDSGCAMSCSSEDSQGFRFAEPCGFAPRRLNSMDSPRRCLQFSSFSYTTENATDEGCYIDVPSSPLAEGDHEEKLPLAIGSLIRGHIFQENSPRKLEISPRKVESSPRKHQPLQDARGMDNNTPQRRRRSLSFREDLKRPLNDNCKLETSRLKRLKSFKETEESENKGTLFEYGFWKSAGIKPDETEVKKISDSEMNIKMALQRSTQEELIGNFTRPFALPLISGKHEDLKTISCDTLADLIKGKYEDSVESFKIIDCRYPYEFEGGHIKGAINLYTCDHISKELLCSKEKPKEASEEQKRDILVFHCEFSCERGPFLSRFLRKEDRASNEYPNLHHPEIYLLHGGYSQFFKSYEEFCEPKSYRTMQDPDHTNELKHFKAKSKSWAPGSHKKQMARSLSRLAF